MRVCSVNLYVLRCIYYDANVYHFLNCVEFKHNKNSNIRKRQNKYLNENVVQYIIKSLTFVQEKVKQTI